MNIKIRQIVCLLSIALLPASVSAQILKQDASFRTGKLKNGLTYYIRHNHQTPNVADFYIAQRVGSIQEEPRQRGLAHFLEHMAFNGTKHFPGTDKQPGIVKWCETMGIKFGANLNAYTSVDETVYNISAAPTQREGVIDSCLLILHDWSHYLLLTDEEIDKERGVIHEEWRTRRAGMAVQRLMEQAMPIIYKGSKYEDCMPIGSMDIVDHFPYNDLRDYYHKWYRPDLQAIIVVGDIDVDKIEKKIKKMFSPIPMPKHAAERIYYPVNDNAETIIYTAQDKEQPACIFTLYMKREGTPRAERNTEQYYADSYKADLIRKMLNARLQDIVKQANTPFISASVRDGEFFLASTADAFTGSATLKQENVLGGISTLVTEMERARQFGFTQSELDRAKAEQLRYAEDDYASRNDNRNSHYVRQSVRNFLDGEPMLSAEDELDLVRKLTQSVTLADINAEVKALITDKNQVITLYGPAKDDYKLPADADIVSCVSKAQQQKLEAYVDRVLPASLMKSEPKAGSIVSEDEAQFGYHHLLLSNGMNVYVKTTDLEADNIDMNLFSKGGESYYGTCDMPSLAYLTAVVRGGGVGDFSDNDLDKMLAGKTVNVAPFVSDETEGMRGSSNVKNLRTMLQLTHLYFTQPRRDEEAFQSLMNRQSSFLTNRDANPNVSFGDSITAILYGNNPRLAPVKKETLKKVSLDRIYEIYKERFADASDFNVIFTGQVSLDSLRPLLCQYLASLPSLYKKEDVQDVHTDIRPGREVHAIYKHQQTPSTLCNIYITSRLPYTADNDLKLSALCQLLRIDYTEKVREEQGGTYGVSVQGQFTKYPYPEALMKINFRTDPEKFDQLIPIVYAQLDSMAQLGPTQQNLDKVKAYELKTYGQAAKLNNYWEYCMYNQLFNGIDFDTDYTAKVAALTPEAIRDFARQLLAPNNCIEITMKPKK